MEDGGGVLATTDSVCFGAVKLWHRAVRSILTNDLGRIEVVISLV